MKDGCSALAQHWLPSGQHQRWLLQVSEAVARQQDEVQGLHRQREQLQAAEARLRADQDQLGLRQQAVQSQLAATQRLREELLQQQRLLAEQGGSSSALLQEQLARSQREAAAAGQEAAERGLQLQQLKTEVVQSQLATSSQVGSKPASLLVHKLTPEVPPVLLHEWPV